MTNEATDTYEGMDEESRQAWEAWERGARKWATISRTEADRAAAVADFARISSKSDRAFRDYVLKNYGYDPF